MKALKWLDLHFEEMFLTILLIVLTSLMTVNVILRYVMGSGITWSEAICRYCLVYSTFFTIAHWVRRGNGICVDFVLQIAPKSIVDILRWLVYVLQIVFFGFLFISSLRVLSKTYATGTVDGTLGFNMAYIYLACCIGFCDATIRSIQVFILNLPMFNKEDK